MRLLGPNVCGRTISAAALAAASSLTFAGAAGAQDLQIDPRPSIDVTVAPPPAPVQRTYQIHEGLYVRAALGLGLIGADLSDDAGGPDISSGGLELQADLLIGGGPSPGLTIGGGVQYATQLSGDWEVEDTDLVVSSGDLSTFVIGPFVDGYPTPNDGWHFGGLAGLAIATFDPGPGSDGNTAIGFGGSAWLGHDVWVAPEWSLGGMLKLGALRATDDDITATKLSLSVLFTVVVN
ncbi:MAG: hypothetical protein ABW217_01875 [Polyangiaceae bacterium]